jgi:hypothetical protein
MTNNIFFSNTTTFACTCNLAWHLIDFRPLLYVPKELNHWLLQQLLSLLLLQLASVTGAAGADVNAASRTCFKNR